MWFDYGRSYIKKALSRVVYVAQIPTTGLSPQYLDESLNQKVENSKLFFKQQRIIQMTWIVFFFLLICIYAYFNDVSSILVSIVSVAGISILLLYT
jgi:hypothetical protein